MKILNTLLFTTAICVIAQAKSVPNTRIAGGRDARRGQFPFAAAITYTTADGIYSCAGALITNQWILTAARCVYDATSFEIVLGATDLTAQESTEAHFITSSKEIHPDFNPDFYDNDVGLIKLHLAIQFSYFISPANLPFTHISNYSSVIGIGWGETSASSSQNSPILQFVPLTSIPNEECARNFGDIVTDNIVCVAGNDLEGPCRGDMGGPLIEVANGGIVSYIVGVQSFLASTCESTFPSGYSRIYPYIDWIRSYTNLNP